MNLPRVGRLTSRQQGRRDGFSGVGRPGRVLDGYNESVWRNARPHPTLSGNLTELRRALNHLVRRNLPVLFPLRLCRRAPARGGHSLPLDSWKAAHSAWIDGERMLPSPREGTLQGESLPQPVAMLSRRRGLFSSGAAGAAACPQPSPSAPGRKAQAQVSHRPRCRRCARCQRSSSRRWRRTGP